MHGQHIVTRDVLDVEEFILSRDLADRDHLDAVFLAGRCVEKQVAEIARPLAFLQRFFQVIDLRFIDKRISQVQDVTCVRTVEEMCCLLVATGVACATE